MFMQRRLDAYQDKRLCFKLQLSCLSKQAQ